MSYTKGEVVWAKIKGFPWWPGVVAKVIEDRDNPDHAVEALVNFIGENSHARLPMDKVAKFEENYVEFSKMKKKKLLESIDIARKIIAGETSYEDEREKLERKDKGLPTPAGKRKRDPKDSAQEEESEEESEAPASPSSSKSKQKAKISEKKNTKMKQLNENFNKSPIPSKPERSPIIIKNKRTMSNASQISNGLSNGPQKAESDPKDIGKPRIRKMLKLDNDQEEHRQILKENTPHLNIQTIPIHKSVSETIEIERKPERPILKAIRPASNPFGDVHESLIEKIANIEASNMNTIEKKINAALAKLNIESAPMSELIEKEVGKNIHTLLILFDELSSMVPNMEHEISEKISNLKETLLTASNTIKVRLSLHFVENIDFCSSWLKKLHERKEIKEHERREAEKIEKEPEVEVINPRETKLRKEPSTQRSHQDKDSIVSEQSGSKEANDKIVEELSNGMSSAIEEEKHDEGSQSINFRDAEETKPRAENGHSKNNKMQKPKPKAEVPLKQTKSAEAKPTKDNSAINTTLRKKICLKMAKLLQDKNDISKEEAQDLTLKIENKIRGIFPEMGEYKDKILIVLKLIKVEAYQKQKPDAAIGLEHGLVEDAPSFNRESKSEIIGAFSETNGEGINIETSN